MRLQTIHLMLEVFQRALGRPAGTSDLVRLDSLRDLSEGNDRSYVWLPWAGLVIALIVTLLLVFGLAL